MKFWRALLIFTLGCISVGLSVTLGTDYLQRHDPATARLRAEMAEVLLEQQFEQYAVEVVRAERLLEDKAKEQFRFILGFNAELERGFASVEELLTDFSPEKYLPVRGQEVLRTALTESRWQQSRWRENYQALLLGKQELVGFRPADVIAHLHMLDREVYALETIAELPEFRAESREAYRYARAQILSLLLHNQMRLFSALNSIYTVRQICGWDYNLPVIANIPRDVRPGDSLHLSMQLAYFSDNYGPDRAWVVINGDTLATKENGEVEYRGIAPADIARGIHIETLVANPLTGEVRSTELRHLLDKE
ncbi:hypothetical protein [Lewinella sp. W8]|uniref:hypothetical protein n=1 Tax=Lewinella sp. W8 TaxID=2528208 RepID=UPI001067C8CC|nr:hypothetical protein [Lewinella sp. W8]MTB53448.1 hypothetical protein [Lewinella sp. W8]